MRVGLVRKYDEGEPIIIFDGYFIIGYVPTVLTRERLYVQVCIASPVDAMAEGNKMGIID